jgi:hypothetical protein
MSAECFKIHATDNVATLLKDAGVEAEVMVRGESEPFFLHTTSAIKAGHKIALRPLTLGTPILKYGFAIGEATQPIAQGEWVHLHNCRSLYDKRSSNLDIESGARKDTQYA